MGWWSSLLVLELGDLGLAGVVVAVASIKIK